MRVLGIIVLACAATAYGGDAAAGKSVYDRACKSCHGPDGAGNPGIAKAMKVEMKDIRQLSDADVKKAIADGKGKMKPVASVNAAQADDVVAYLRSLK